MSGLRAERAELLAGLSVRRLRWILHHADADLTVAAAVKASSEAVRQEDAAGEHQALVEECHRYVSRRRGRELDLVRRAGDEAKDAAIRRGPISREDAYFAGKEGADLERLRFEVYEPQLSFEAWVAAGRPEVHRARSATPTRGAA